MNIKGRYEVRVALVDLITLDHFNEDMDREDRLYIDNNSTDEDFYKVAETLGTVFTLGGFTKCINNDYVDLSGYDSYVRVFLVNTDNPENKLTLLDNSLIIKDGETSNEKLFREYNY